MPKNQRIIVFLTVMALLLVIYGVFKTPIDTLSHKGILIISVLIMLSFAILLVEHYFTRPTDIVASTVSILLLLSPLYSELKDMGLWYWLFWGYNLSLLIISLVSLSMDSPKNSPTSRSNKISKTLKEIALRFGNGKLLWFSLLALCVVFYVDSQSPLFITLFVYAMALLLIEPQKALLWIKTPDTRQETAVAELFGIQSSSIYLATVYPDSPSIKRFGVAGFMTNAGGHESWKVGLVVEAYELNEQRWLKILTDDSFGELEQKTTVPEKPKKGIVHLLPIQGELDLVNYLVGIVCEDTTIEKLKFKYLFNVSIQEGELLQVLCGEQTVLYQVVEGITGTESLEARNKAGFIIGEAIQVGVWNAEKRSFDRYGWVPNMNNPVLKAKDINVLEPLPNEYKIGSVPGTNFPIFIDLETAVTHHLAVLGITGSGKSVFARNLIRQISDNKNTKVICVDFTNEYGSKLADLVKGSLVQGGERETMFSAIDEISSQMDKFASQRDTKLIARQEKILRDSFEISLQAFVKSDEKAVLFELPDVSNSTGIFEYTKWFFKVLFELAKAKGLDGKTICVVLEEAHTIVPEWNFLGIEDKRSNATVNSICQIALQGRKYGVGFVVIAQRTANVSKNVLTQCNSVVAFQQFDRTSADFLGNYMSSDYVASLTRLRPRHAIAVGKAFSGGMPMIFAVPDIEEHEPPPTSDN